MAQGSNADRRTGEAGAGPSAARGEPGDHWPRLDRSARVGTVLRQLRLSRGLTLVEVARRAGCAKSYVSAIECGRQASPRPRMLRLLERAVDAPAGLLARAAWLQAEPSVAESDRGEHPPDNPSMPSAFELDDRGLASRVAAPPARLPETWIVVRVTDDRMSPVYEPGDVVAFDRTAIATRGDDVLASIAEASAAPNPRPDPVDGMPGRWAFARAYWEHDQGRVRLQPVNPAYGARVVSWRRIRSMYPAVLLLRPVKPMVR